MIDAPLEVETPQWCQAHIFDAAAIQADITDVLLAQISSKSRNTYDEYNKHLILLFFDNCSQFPVLIKEDFMATFIVSHEEGCTCRTKSGKPSKLRTSLNKSIQEALSSISADDQSTHPLYLNKLNFHTLACCLSTLSKTFTRHSSPDDTIIVEGDANANRNVTIRLKSSSYDGVLSSLTNLFTE